MSDAIFNKYYSIKTKEELNSYFESLILMNENNEKTYLRNLSLLDWLFAFNLFVISMIINSFNDLQSNLGLTILIFLCSLSLTNIFLIFYKKSFNHKALNNNKVLKTQIPIYKLDLVCEFKKNKKVVLKQFHTNKKCISYDEKLDLCLLYFFKGYYFNDHFYKLYLATINFSYNRVKNFNNGIISLNLFAIVVIIFWGLLVCKL